MEYLNWIAEHWLLAIVLTMIISGGFQNMVRAMAKAYVERGNQKAWSDIEKMCK
jgi:hypothetical protein